MATVERHQEAADGAGASVVTLNRNPLRCPWPGRPGRRPGRGAPSPPPDLREPLVEFLPDSTQRVPSTPV